MIKRYREFYTALVISCTVIAAGFAGMLFLNQICAFVFLAAGAVILFLFSAVTYKRIKEIRILSEYLQRINDGEFDLDIQDNREGELSILKNNIYKAVVTLRSQSELLKKDKTFLADSLADISHQLKTPITSMTIMTDLLRQESDDDKRREFVDVINSQLAKMNWLIITLLKLSKIDAGAVEFKKEFIYVKDLIKNSVSPFLISAELKGVEIITKCDDNLFINADENWFAEALSNIVKNCVEHTESGGRVSVKGFQSPVYTSIVIEDNGTGIDKEDLPYIFERFYKGKNQNDTSVGIGLALSKAVLNRNGAVVDVFSEKNIGTRFEIKVYKTVI